MCKYQSSRYRLFYVFYTYIIISALVSYTIKYQRVDMLTLDDRMDYLYINHLTYGITKFYRETHFVTCPNSCQQNSLNARGQEKVSVSLLSEEKSNNISENTMHRHNLICWIFLRFPQN